MQVDRVRKVCARSDVLDLLPVRVDVITRYDIYEVAKDFIADYKLVVFFLRYMKYVDVCALIVYRD